MSPVKKPDGTPEVQKETCTPLRFLLTASGLITKQIIIDGAARDSGNTPTSTLRAGLTMALAGGTGPKYKEYVDTTNDPAEGILMQTVDMLDKDGSNRDRNATILTHGYVDETYVYGIDTAGKTDLGDKILWG